VKKQIKIISLKTSLTAADEKDVPAYDHTALSAVNTCPTWGLIRYGKHKVMPDAGRAMALEAGEAAHESFAAIRLFQLLHYDAPKHGDVMIEAAKRHGVRLFGEERFASMMKTLDANQLERTNIINFALDALYSCGFYDSDSDKKRTVTNVAEALIAYIDRIQPDRYPIWIRDPSDVNTDVGIEIAFDIMVTIEYEEDSKPNTMRRRLQGKLDGLVFNGNRLMVDENKTGARLDDAWLAQWQLSHQITGYCLAGATFTNLSCDDARVVGMRIPIGKTLFEGIRFEDVNRSQFQYIDWAVWFVHTVELFEQHVNDVTHAPRFTHSCNRYFRPCSLLAYCGSDIDERARIIEEMEHDKWSPVDD
jgi:hypothetical protein